MFFLQTQVFIKVCLNIRASQKGQYRLISARGLSTVPFCISILKMYKNSKPIVQCRALHSKQGSPCAVSEMGEWERRKNNYL